MNFFRRASRREEGFTLFELMAVVVIIGILAAIAIPNYTRQRARAYDASSVSDVTNNIAAAANTWVKEHPGWKGPYKDEILSDVVTSDGTLWNILPVESAVAPSPSRTTAFCIVAYNSKGSKYGSGLSGANKPVTYASDQGGLNTDGAGVGACANVTKLSDGPDTADKAKNDPAYNTGPYGLKPQDSTAANPADTGSRPAIYNTSGTGAQNNTAITPGISYPAGYQPTGTVNTTQSAAPRTTGVYDNKYFSMVEVKCNTDAVDMTTQYSYKNCVNGTGQINVSMDSNSGQYKVTKTPGVANATISFKVKVIDDSGRTATTSTSISLGSNT